MDAGRKERKEERKGELITKYGNFELRKLRITNYGINKRSFVMFCRQKKETISAAAYVQSGTDDQFCSRGFQSTGRQQTALKGRNTSYRRV